MKCVVVVCFIFCLICLTQNYLSIKCSTFGAFCSVVSLTNNAAKLIQSLLHLGNYPLFEVSTTTVKLLDVQ